MCKLQTIRISFIFLSFSNQHKWNYRERQMKEKALNVTKIGKNHLCMFQSYLLFAFVLLNFRNINLRISLTSCSLISKNGKVIFRRNGRNEFIFVNDIYLMFISCGLNSYVISFLQHKAHSTCNIDISILLSYTCYYYCA